MEQLNSSLTDLEKAVKMAPHSAHAAYSLASSYYRMAALNQSMQLIEMAQMKFEEALLKFPDYYEGLVQHAMVRVVWYLHTCNIYAGRTVAYDVW